MSEQTTPQVGQWWHDSSDGELVYVAHRSRDGRLWIENRHSQVLPVWATAATWSTRWRHVPECTGWAWQPKRKVVWRLWVKEDHTTYSLHRFHGFWRRDDSNDLSALPKGAIRTDHTEERDE